MSNEPDQEEPSAASETQGNLPSEESAPQPDSHQQVLDAAREAEEAVAASALSPGLTYSH